VKVCYRRQAELIPFASHKEITENLKERFSYGSAIDVPVDEAGWRANS
jgi:hypothetical protein